MEPQVIISMKDYLEVESIKTQNKMNIDLLFDKVDECNALKEENESLKKQLEHQKTLPCYPRETEAEKIAKKCRCGKEESDNSENIKNAIECGMMISKITGYPFVVQYVIAELDEDQKIEWNKILKNRK